MTHVEAETFAEAGDKTTAVDDLFPRKGRRTKWIGFLNDLFYDRSYIAGLGELSISFSA